MLRNHGFKYRLPKRDGPQNPYEPVPSAARIELTPSPRWIKHGSPSIIATSTWMIRHTTFELAFALRHRHSFEIAPNVLNKLPAFSNAADPSRDEHRTLEPWAVIHCEIRETILAQTYGAPRADQSDPRQLDQYRCQNSGLRNSNASASRSALQMNLQSSWSCSTYSARALAQPLLALAAPPLVVLRPSQSGPPPCCRYVCDALRCYSRLLQQFRRSIQAVHKQPSKRSPLRPATLERL